MDHIRKILVNGFKAAFLPFHEKQQLLRQIVRELEGFDAEGFAADRGEEAAAAAPKGGAKDEAAGGNGAPEAESAAPAE